MAENSVGLCLGCDRPVFIEAHPAGMGKVLVHENGSVECRSDGLYSLWNFPSEKWTDPFPTKKARARWNKFGT